MIQIPGVGALQTHHPGVAAELPVQLTIPHVHGIDLGGAVLQHAVGKAAGGGADVGAGLSCQRNRKGLHGLFQLQSAAADVGQRVAAHLHRCVLRHGGTGLIHPLSVDEDKPRHNICLCLLAAVQQAALHQKHIQSYFFTHASTSLTAAVTPAASSPSA